jgi:hypothetical protein
VIAPPALPKEHGAWVMLALPLLLGLSLGGGRSAAWGVPVAAILAFLAHYALVPLIQRARGGKPGPAEWTRARRTWGAAYLAGAALSFAFSVVLCAQRPPLLVLAAVSGTCAAVYFVAAAFGSGREIWSELVGMVGMALAAPLTTAAAESLDRRGWTAAAIALAYCLSSVAFVRAYGAMREDRGGSIARCAAAHAAILAGLVLLVLVGGVTPWPLVVLLLPFARSVWGFLRPPANLRALGLREMWVAIAVAFGAVLLLHAGGA